jgi:hypothetical protein
MRSANLPSIIANGQRAQHHEAIDRNELILRSAATAVKR